MDEDGDCNDGYPGRYEGDNGKGCLSRTERETLDVEYLGRPTEEGDVKDNNEDDGYWAGARETMRRSTRAGPGATTKAELK